jgi:hypothetical protein
MTIFRVYETDLDGMKKGSTVDFVFDEDDEFEDFGNYDVEERPNTADVLEDTEYSHVNHGVETVTFDEMKEIREGVQEKIDELEDERETIDRAIFEYENRFEFDIEV